MSFSGFLAKILFFRKWIYNLTEIIIMVKITVKRGTVLR